jgi:hypothetical protein
MPSVSVTLNQVSGSRASTGSDDRALLAADNRAAHCSGNAADNRASPPAVVMSTPLGQTFADEGSEQQNQPHDDRHDASI